MTVFARHMPSIKSFKATAALIAALHIPQALPAEPPDLSGNWQIQSSVGGEIPITVNCTLIQEGADLSGTCTPVMENPQPSELAGTVEGNTASWGYDVVFNGNPGRVDFMADELSGTTMKGTLSLSGTEAPFEAVKE